MQSPSPVLYSRNMKGKLEISVAGVWVETTEFIFRSWRGERRVDGVPWVGTVFEWGTLRVAGS